MAVLMTMTGGSGGGGREGAAGRFLTSNGTMHGQSIAVNSPASVQSPSSTSKHVRQPVQQQKQTKTNFKTVRSLQCLNPTGQPLNSNATIRKQAEIKITADIQKKLNLFMEACRGLTPALAARCSKIPIEIFDDILYR